ncbi:MAG: hemolysin III family protein [Microthrixaceae bacterium]
MEPINQRPGLDTAGVAETSTYPNGMRPSGAHPNVTQHPDILERSGVSDWYGLRPVWRGRLHAIAFIFAMPAGLYLLSATETTGARIAVAVYWASLAGLFGTSATYHLRARSQSAVRWFRRADHSMIFMLIAGTYTPLCLIALPRVWGIPMLVVAWVTALAGVILKMVSLGERLDDLEPKGKAGLKGGSWLYIVLGWGAVITLPVLIGSLNSVQLLLLGAGGVLYTAGAVAFGLHRPILSPERFGYHEVWHAMTIAAGTCHFLLVVTLVN